MLLADLVATSAAVAATRSRKAKVAALAETLGRVEPVELEVVVSYLGGTLRQRRTGLGWRGVSDLPSPADEPSLTVLEVHQAFEAMSRMSGSGATCFALFADPAARDAAASAADARGWWTLATTMA